jgi:hypothetical protein
MQISKLASGRFGRVTLLVIGALAQLLAMSPVASGAATPKTVRYTALSKTAYSITGNVTVKEYGGLVRTIAFQNGSSLNLTGAGRDGVYLVTPPADPILLNRNHLCGRGERATRVALTWGIHGAFSMSVYSGRSLTDLTLCGTFNYTNP